MYICIYIYMRVSRQRGESGKPAPETGLRGLVGISEHSVVDNSPQCVESGPVKHNKNSRQVA